MGRCFCVATALVVSCLLSCLLSPAAGAAVLRVALDAPAGSVADGRSWETAFPSVGAALAAAQPGDELWVKRGVYEEQLVLKAQVALYGGFSGTEAERAQRSFGANETVIRHPNISVIQAPRGTADGATLDGFTVRDGGSEIFYGGDGGLLNITADGVTVANCRLMHGYGGSGGAVYCLGGYLTLRNNVIQGNVASSAGGGVYCAGTKPVIQGNLVTGNRGRYGGGIHLSAPSFTLDGNTIALNDGVDGAGVSISGAQGSISRCILRGNTSSGDGGGISVRSADKSPADVVVRECVFLGNQARNGGGIFGVSYTDLAAKVNVILINNTFVGNVGIGDNPDMDMQRGVVSLAVGTFSLANNLIAYNNSGVSLDNSVAFVKNNCVFANEAYNYAGIADPTGKDGNISADPKLAGAGYGDVHIQPDSPCRDAGANAFVEAGEVDMDAEPRTQNGRVDIGADESDGAARAFAPRVVRVRPGGDDANDGATWATAKRTLEAAVSEFTTAGGEIWVAEGTYGAGAPLLTYMVRGGMLYLYGGFAGTEAEREMRDPDAHPTRLEASVSMAGGHTFGTLDGFQLVGGASCLSGASPRISGNDFFSSLGVKLASPRILDNAFHGCGMTIDGARAEIRGNSVARGRLYATFSSLSVIGNTFLESSVGINQYTATDTGDSLVFVGNVLADYADVNRADDAALNVNGLGSVLIADNLIRRNRRGVFLRNIGSAWVLNNTLVQNGLGQNGASLSLYGMGATVANNIVAWGGIGIATDDPTATLAGNCVYGNGQDYAGVPDPTGRDGNIREDPRFVSLMYGDFHIRPDSPCRDAGDDAFVAPGDTDMDGEPRIQNGRVEIGADESDGTVRVSGPRVIRVRPDGRDAEDGATWATAKRTIQAALDGLAMSGGQVWVAAGVYRENLIIGSNRSLFGGFRGDEALPLDRDPATNTTVIEAADAEGYNVTFRAGSSGTRLDGFTVRNGRGIYCRETDAAIAGNTLTLGGGICLSKASATIIGNHLIGTTTGIEAFGTTLSVADNRIEGMLANAHGAVYADSTSVLVLTDNTILDNAGVGVTCFGNSVVSGNIIIGNSAQDGAGVTCTGPVQVTDNAIIGNSASNQGGGIKARDGAYIAHNRIEGNAAGSGGGVSGVGITVEDNLIRLNSGGAVALNGGVNRIVRNDILDNKAVNYAGISMFWSVAGNEIANNVIARNTSTIGRSAAMDVLGPAMIRNNSIFLNVSGAAGDGSIRLRGQADLVFVNNVVYRNTGGLYRGPSDSPTVRFNDIYLNGAGLDAIGFTEDLAAQGNFALEPGISLENWHSGPFCSSSLLVDAGDDSVVPEGDLDLGGYPRIQGRHVDIGATESTCPGRYTMREVTMAMRAAAGIMPAAMLEYDRLNIEGRPGPEGAVDLLDAYRILRKALGFEPNP